MRWIDSLSSSGMKLRWIANLPAAHHSIRRLKSIAAPEQYFGFPYVRQFNTMLIEPHTYLRALMRDFYVAGGKIVVKEFRKREEIARLSEHGGVQLHRARRSRTI